MRSGAPEFLKGLWLILPLIGLVIWMHRRRAARLGGLISSTVWKTVIPGYSPKRIRRRTTLRLLALFCILLALTRPQWGYKMEEVKQRGLDIIIVLDTSKSMLATDIKPNRLQQAKWAVRDFVQHLKGDRIGLVAFAGSSFLQCPVTVDYAAFTMTLNDLYAGIIPRGGTAIAQALETAETSFAESGGDRVILLITDGENHEGDPLKIAKKLNKKQIKLFSIGVGTAEGELVPAANGRGYLKDQRGRVVKSTLNETLLEKLASETGGFYVRSAPGDFGLDRIYQLGIAGLQRDEQETRLARIYEERFGWFVAAALLFLAAEGLLRAPKAALLLLLLFCTPRVEAEENWKKAYRAGNYTNAFQRLEQMTEKVPDVGNYNRGNILYRMNDFQGSEKSYAAAAQTDDETLRQKALYNRGTALLAGVAKTSAPGGAEAALQAVTQAIDLLEQACALNPADSDAKKNLERALALKEKLEQKKKEQEKQKENEKKKDPPPDQSEKSDPENQQQEPPQKQEQKQKNKAQQGESQADDTQQEQAPPQPKQAGEMSKEEAQQLLDAMKQNEKDQRTNLRPYLGQPVRVDKDW